MRFRSKRWIAAALIAAAGVTIQASSHREAPGITHSPKLDGTDFYMFRSYETGRSGFITLIANFVPLQDVYGGPNFFTLDPDAVYEIHVDNTGDAREDVTFQFQFRNRSRNLTVPVGDRDVAVPLVNIGGLGPAADDTANLNVLETYTVTMIRGDRRTGQRSAIRNAADGRTTFRKPADRIGDKSIRSQRSDHLRAVRATITSTTSTFRDAEPAGCSSASAAKDSSSTWPRRSISSTPTRSVRSMPKKMRWPTRTSRPWPSKCRSPASPDSDPVIGAWATASRMLFPKLDLPFLFQVSRLGSPLVNELVIGLKDKDAFNASEPKDDAQFAEYVTHPTLPVLVQALFGVPAPAAPRNDLVQVFLTGVPGLNRPNNVKAAEMLRLNTSVPPVAPAAQNPIGVLGGDLAGFPNGRRVGDDVVDIALRAAEGILLSANPASFPAVTDGAFVNATVSYTPDGAISTDPAFRLFRDTFPYLQTPLSGSPNPTHQ